MPVEGLAAWSLESTKLPPVSPVSRGCGNYSPDDSHGCRPTAWMGCAMDHSKFGFELGDDTYAMFKKHHQPPTPPIPPLPPRRPQPSSSCSHVFDGEEFAKFAGTPDTGLRAGTEPRAKQRWSRSPWLGPRGVLRPLLRTEPQHVARTTEAPRAVAGAKVQSQAEPLQCPQRPHSSSPREGSVRAECWPLGMGRRRDPSAEGRGVAGTASFGEVCCPGGLMWCGNSPKGS